jgi:hypothetical protein
MQDLRLGIARSAPRRSLPRRDDVSRAGQWGEPGETMPGASRGHREGPPKSRSDPRVVGSSPGLALTCAACGHNA